MRNPLAWMFPGPRRRRRDFSRPTEEGGNPLFAQPARRRIPWLAIFGLVAILAAAGYVLVDPRFRITEVRIAGAQKLDPGSIQNFVDDRLHATTLGIAWRRVKWLVPTEELARDVQTAASRLIPLASVNIERHGSVLTVTISEQIPDVLWERADGDRFYVNAAGMIVEAVPPTLTDDLVVIRDRNRLNAEIGTRVVHPSVLIALKTARERLASLDLNITAFSTWPVSCSNETIEPAVTTTANANGNTNRPRVNENTNIAVCDPKVLAIDEPSFTAALEEGWELRLSGANDINAQFDKLAVALRERLQNRTGLEYVDVRFGDRVFFR